MIKSYDLNTTKQGDSNDHSHTSAHGSEKRHRPHRDNRKFLMLVEDNGDPNFKACSPTCVDVDWSAVPFKKRIVGFGRKSKGQNALPQDFIPGDLTIRKTPKQVAGSSQRSKESHTFPNATSPHVPWEKDDVSYRAILSTPLHVDFEKCVSHMQRTSSGWTEEERCHRINWDDIPVGDFIAGFGRKEKDSTAEDLPVVQGSLSKRGVPPGHYPIVSFLFSNLYKSHRKAVLATRTKHGRHVWLWECSTAVNLSQHPESQEGCMMIKDKYGLGGALGTLIAPFKSGYGLGAASAAILLLMTCPLAVVFLVGGFASVFLVPFVFILAVVRLKRWLCKYLMDTTEDVEKGVA